MSGNKKATTLFNLKDEYIKAKHDVYNTNQTETSNKKLKDIIHFRKEEREKKALERSAKQRKRDARLALTEKEEQDLAKSRSILEAKSAIYDKLVSKAGEDCSESILVDFSQKWTDNVDLPHAEDTVGTRNDSPKPGRTGYYTAPSSRSDDDLSSRDQGPDEVHFSNVDRGEVRSKGVGFYSFSEDASIRQQQMDFLNSMRESTERSRELFQASKMKKRQEKLDRLNRLRSQLGMEALEKLPGEKEVLEDEEELEKVNEPIITPGAKIDGNRPGPNPVNFITRAGKRPEKSIEEHFLQREQSLWEKRVEDLRNERETEFAPYYENESHQDHRKMNYDASYNNQPMDDEIDEESDEIVNFISFVRRNT